MSPAPHRRRAAAGLLIALVTFALRTTGCKPPPPPPDPVKESFHAFVAEAGNRIAEWKDSGLRIRIGSGRGFDPASADRPATGRVEVSVESPLDWRRGLRTESAIAVSEHALEFTLVDGRWTLSKGTTRRRVSKAFNTTGTRKAEELEPESTAGFTTFAAGSILADLFLPRGAAPAGKKPDDKPEAK